jgi:calcyclin binding protein
VPTDQIELIWEPNSVEVLIHELEGRNYRLKVPNLFAEISGAVFKPRSSGFGISLTKKEPQNWDTLEKPKKVELPKGKKKAAEPAAPAESGEDPSASLMNMMKEMYETGDDDMKKTINEAWSKANNEKK